MDTKIRAKIRRHRRVRRLVAGTPERPRLAVFRSNRHIYAQLIDDVNGRTVATASTLESAVGVSGSKKDAAKRVGTTLAQRARENGVTAVVFDRGGNLYHGRVASLAEGAREAGLEF